MMNVYTVKDEKLNAYLNPFFAVNTGIALRMMFDSASDPQSVFHNHSEDFVLYKIGTFDEIVGEIIPETKTVVTTVQRLMEKQNEA